MGHCDEDLPQPAGAFARLPAAALPRTLVASRTHPRPGGARLGAGEMAHIGANLRDEALGRALAHPGKRVQEGQGRLVRCAPLGHCPTHTLAGLIQVLQRAQVPGEQEAGHAPRAVRTGLLRGSFSPSKPQRELRELTRYRSTLVQDRARALNRLQAVLEDANVKLASVAYEVALQPRALAS
jgi:hypothetical protein